MAFQIYEARQNLDPAFGLVMRGRLDPVRRSFPERPRLPDRFFGHGCRWLVAKTRWPVTGRLGLAVMAKILAAFSPSRTLAGAGDCLVESGSRTPRCPAKWGHECLPRSARATLVGAVWLALDSLRGFTSQHRWRRL